MNNKNKVVFNKRTNKGTNNKGTNNKGTNNKGTNNKGTNNKGTNNKGTNNKENNHIGNELKDILKQISDDVDGMDNIQEIHITKVEGPALFRPQKKTDKDDPFQGFLRNLLNINEKKEEFVKPEIYTIDETKEYKEISNEINTLEDLIKLGKELDDNINYSFDVKKLKRIIPSLEKLQEAIGMDEPKKNIVKQVIYFLSGFETLDNMMHTVILGSPGTGKTMLGRIIGEIYYNLGMIEKKKSNKDGLIFEIATRDDLIAEYLGQTAIKTKKFLEKCIGGVIFIDEVYSLGNDTGRDIYSKECIDTINQFLSENKNKIVCIIAGYEEQVDKCFFGQNEGLKRRFPFRYKIENYNADELTEILYKMIKEKNWTIDNIKEVKQFIKQHYESFPYFGGDIENLFFSIRIAHSKRIFGKNTKLRTIITMDDVKNGYEIYNTSRKNKKEILNYYL